MSIFDEPKLDSHIHVLEPARFPYGAATPYRPAGQEVASFAQFQQVMPAYGLRRCLIVGPNSGYGTDNRCLLDAIAKSGGHAKGVAVVPLDCPNPELAALKAKGIVGIAFNATFVEHSVAYYMGARDLIDRLAELDMFLQIQVEGDMLAEMMPLLAGCRTRLVIDHCGRPIVSKGIGQPGFQALLELGRSKRAAVKLSGIQKLSEGPNSYRNAEPFIAALIEAFGPDQCVWGSDWPFLRAGERLDYGVLLKRFEALVPDPGVRRRIMWETPCRLFGFQPAA